MIYAFTHRFEDGSTGLTVVRSPAVKDTDPVFAPVADALERFTAEVVVSETQDDQDMMFGQAELTVYRLTEKEI
jgi:hypothetical protein